MGHCIQALIGSHPSTKVIADTWSAVVRRELAPGLFIVPLSPTALRQMIGEELSWPDLEAVAGEREFATTLEPLVDRLRTLRPPGALALVLTEYFGGEGEQAALLFRDGELQARPFLGIDSINTVLRHLGVERDEATSRDEFDVVGLGRWRSNDDIAQGAG